MSPERLTRELEARALAEGFDAVGIAAASPPRRDRVRLEEWLDGGMHAEMQWMERYRAQRADPGLLVEGCRSVVLVAMNYWAGEVESVPVPGRGRVARYAWGRDYHKVMGKKLRRLADWLRETSGAAARSFVDTAPVLERSFAEQAGLGWIGKNANLLSRERGSWLLLGEILSAAELVRDAGPHADHCGECVACLEACPTRAITEPGVVDSNLCISYWTIEHRGPIPEDRRAGIGEWIFGCDVCQEVCPWNRKFAEPTPAERFDRRADLPQLDPLELLAMDEAEFRRRFSGTALMRARWQGMRRNACVVLGNTGPPSAIPALTSLIDDDDREIAAHAAWAVAEIRRRSGTANI